jgi:hypothetical protein
LTPTGIGAGGGTDAVDVAVVEAVHPGGEPGVLLVPEHELQRVGKVMQVLADMVRIDGLGRLGELGGGDVPVHKNLGPCPG